MALANALEGTIYQLMGCMRKLVPEAEDSLLLMMAIVYEILVTFSLAVVFGSISPDGRSRQCSTSSGGTTTQTSEASSSGVGSVDITGVDWFLVTLISTPLSVAGVLFATALSRRIRNPSDDSSSGDIRSPPKNTSADGDRSSNTWAGFVLLLIGVGVTVLSVTVRIQSGGDFFIATYIVLTVTSYLASAFFFSPVSNLVTKAVQSYTLWVACRSPDVGDLAAPPSERHQSSDAPGAAYHVQLSSSNLATKGET